MEPNEFNSQVSDHIIPESDQHFSDFSIESSQEIVASTPSKKKPHPFSFCVMKSFIPQSYNSDLSYEDSFEQSSSHASKSGEHISRSWQLKASLSDSNHFSYEDNPTACSSKAVASGLSDNRATPSSCDNNDNMSVHTNVPSPPSFSKQQQKNCSSVLIAEEVLPDLSGDNITSCNGKQKSARTSKSSKSSKRELRCSMAVCENPYYVVFDPNHSYLTQHKHRPVDKPQVYTRLPLIWPLVSWELPDDPFDNDSDITDVTAQNSDKLKDESDSIWPQNTRGFFSCTASKVEPISDLVFPHNVMSQQYEKQDNYSASNAFDFSVEQALQPSLMHQHESAEESSYNKRSSLLAEMLQEYELAKEGGYLGLQHNVGFTEVDLST